MLKRTFVYSLLGLVIFISLFLLKFLYINEKDVVAYNNLEQKNLAFDSTTAYQKRENVQKDLYVIEKSTRKHYLISSKLSEIFLDRKNQKYQLIENLNFITFICFEDILDNQMMQQIKYITANSGSYTFPSHKLNLFDVNLSFINTLNFNQTSLDQASFSNAYFQGKAKELNFSINKKKPEIKAISFEGSFNPKKSVKCEK
ncbi:MAG: hypothetical protein K1060chlam1_00671 [Candidatus Anoxychlamydiales bacterium]|nr:hypothetical protein [Candidatus Anoxychlamydiales bacterium]